MKPSTSALIGAVIVAGGNFTSLSAVAFAADVRANVSSPAIDARGAAHSGPSTRNDVGTCRAEKHGTSGCTCARCAGVRAE